ncbi:ABC transporter substrate-binding protein [Mediterraneibacter gnavus]|uniref:ABC transporter substrate-binding protein n=1 Tax=Mediterraneibacter gnavus TaxID=33038 RepID=UPI00232D0AC2|nr:ABC transporter substrate-binding protein [Mediterraneibacter gnavus]MDB8710166.1 ABC transporter substrate-binding protein [Mediterraneibacter gnavus]MDB8713365.1 ABC transporter substrate-binding protein [Mediterraneibacter gnavus]
MKKRVISTLLCTVMVVSLLTGCGGDNKKTADNKNSEDGKYKDFITVDVYDEFANYQGIQSGWFAKIVKDKFNMELNIIAPNVAGGGQTLYQTRSAAGELGDLVLVNTSNGKLNDLVSSGLIMDCTDLMDGKDIVKNYGDAIDVTNEDLPEKGMFAFPNSVSTDAATESSEGLEPTFGPYIRWDYYKELGYPKMENLDDFLDVLEDMQKLAREKEGSEDIYAISLFKDWDDNMMNNAKQPACMYGYDEVGFVLSKADGTEEQSILDDDSIYMDVLDFFYEANQRGLVDPDSTTQNYDTWSAKYTDGKVLYCPWPWVGQNLYNTAENKAAGKGFMMAPVEDMQIFSYGSCPEGNSTQVIAIGSNAEDPQRMADFIDWLYSPEGIELNGQANGAAGIKGLTWDINEDGKPELTDFGKKALPMNDVAVDEEYGGGNWKDGVSALNFKTVNLQDIDPNTGEAYDYLTWETTLEDNKTALDEDWSTYMGADTTMEYLEKNDKILVAPGSSYSVPEADSNITTVRGQCKSAIVDGSWKMIFAKDDAEFDSLKKDMQKTAKGLGYDDVLEVDMKNAADQTAARKASAEKYPAESDAE